MYPLIQRGVREGLSGNAIERAAREAGFRFTRQPLLDTIRAERNLQLEGGALRNLRLDMRPNPARLPDALTKLRRAFSYTVELRGRMIDTDEPIRRMVTVSTDRALTRREIQEEAAAFAEDDNERYPLEIDSAVLVHGVKAGAAGRL